MHAYAPDEARQHIIKGRGQHYDPAVVDAFRSLFEERVETPISETIVRSIELKPGMVLARNLRHREGYLVLAKGTHLGDVLIKELLEYEKLIGEPVTVFVRVKPK